MTGEIPRGAAGRDPAEANIEDPVIASNLAYMQSGINAFLRKAQESIAGNAGYEEIGGLPYPAVAANGYADAATGRIVGFGNSLEEAGADVSPEGDHARFTLRILQSRFIELLAARERGDVEAAALHREGRIWHVLVYGAMGGVATWRLKEASIYYNEWWTEEQTRGQGGPPHQ